MNKNKIISFFNALAPDWDKETIKEAEKINLILDLAGIRKGSSVLDVACGTGVLIQDYLDRQAEYICGVDFSSEMIAAAIKKFKNSHKTELFCDDIESFSSDRKFDCAMIYNAFPHFTNTKAIIRNIASLLKPGGRLTVAHNMGIEMLSKHHSGVAADISRPLITADEMQKLFSEENLETDVKISEEGIYVVSAIKK